MKIPTESEQFSEFWKAVNHRRNLQGFRSLTREEVMKIWDIIEAFRLTWGQAPSSATPSDPDGGSGSGAGSEGV